MTDEQDFQAQLDADPSAHHVRLVLADWLDEQGDPRASGYRALGIRRRWAGKWSSTDTWLWLSGRDIGNTLPRDWWEAFYVITVSGRYKGNRRSVEDMAALAFLKLSPERQQELLAVPVLC